MATEPTVPATASTGTTSVATPDAIDASHDVAAATTRPAGGLLAPLRQRDFRLLFGGESISVLGDHFHFVALAWLALQLTGAS